MKALKYTEIIKYYNQIVTDHSNSYFTNTKTESRESNRESLKYEFKKRKSESSICCAFVCRRFNDLCGSLFLAKKIYP